MCKPVYVTKSYMPPRAEFDAYLDRIWKSAWLTNMGELHEELRARLREFLNVGGIELFVNGHAALENAIQAMHFAPGSEIITTPFSFASTTHAVMRQGLVPVFCDIRPSDCTMDPEKIEALITERTAAILPVHVYGNICDVDRIAEIADRHGLKVIYDAAHAFGETRDGANVGNFGDISMFSFHATKVYHSIEGGALTWPAGGTDYEDILYKLKNFGITGPESVEYIGGNAKMNEFQAAMGLCNLQHIGELIAARKEIYGQYVQALSGVPGVRFLQHDDRISYNYAYMPVVFDAPLDRDEIYDRLAARQIFCRKYFYPCINAYECYRDRYDAADTPVAAEISRKILTLPIYPGLEKEIVEEICEVIKH